MLVDAEATLATKHAVKRVSIEELGHGRRNCGGAEGKKNRVEVLKRLAALGVGLSDHQATDFKWFCESWDAKGVDSVGENWPMTFSLWMNSVIEQHLSGNVAAFSQFVHGETARVLAGEPCLALPAVP